MKLADLDPSVRTVNGIAGWCGPKLGISSACVWFGSVRLSSAASVTTTADLLRIRDVMKVTWSVIKDAILAFYVTCCASMVVDSYTCQTTIISCLLRDRQTDRGKEKDSGIEEVALSWIFDELASCMFAAHRLQYDRAWIVEVRRRGELIS